jgi:hypothetical protein
LDDIIKVFTFCEKLELIAEEAAEEENGFKIPNEENYNDYTDDVVD